MLIAHAFDIGCFSGCKQVRNGHQTTADARGKPSSFLVGKEPTAPVVRALCDLLRCAGLLELNNNEHLGVTGESKD
jgi:hypothetical protein